MFEAKPQRRPSPIHTLIRLFITKFWTMDMHVESFCESGCGPGFDIPSSEERLPNDFVCDSSAVARISSSLLSRARGLLERGALFILLVWSIFLPQTRTTMFYEISLRKGPWNTLLHIILAFHAPRQTRLIFIKVEKVFVIYFIYLKSKKKVHNIYYQSTHKKRKGTTAQYWKYWIEGSWIFGTDSTCISVQMTYIISMYEKQTFLPLYSS